MKEEIKRNLLIVNSRDKKSGTTSDFLYNLGENSLEIEGIALKQAAIPHTFSNVRSNNNTFTIISGAQIAVVAPTIYQAQAYINFITYKYELPPSTLTFNEFLNSWNTSILGAYLQLSWTGTRYRITNTIAPIPGSLIDSGLDPGFTNLWTALGFGPTLLPPNPGDQITALNAPSAPFNNVNQTTHTITLTNGQYTTTTLLAEVITKINAVVGGGYTGIVNTDGKVVIDSGAADWDFNNNQDEIPHMLGYEPSNMTPQQVQTAIGLPDLFGTRYLYIASNVLANGYNAIQKNGEKTSILGAIPVCSAYSGIDKWQQQYLVLKKYGQSININEFDIKILDDNGNVVDLQSADVVLEFEIWCTIRL
jgi:hypothetical protein